MVGKFAILEEFRVLLVWAEKKKKVGLSKNTILQEATRRKPKSKK